MKKVLIINLGWEQQPLIERLYETGHQLYAVHNSNNIQHPEWFKSVLHADYRDIPTILQYAHQIQPDAVISDQCDYSAFAQAVIAEELELPGPSIDEQQISVNKWLQRKKCAQKGIPIPEFTLCTNLVEVRDAIRSYGYPVVLKPVDNRGSFGVNRVDRDLDVKVAFMDALANSHSRTVLVERFVEGVHITIDGYVFPGVGPISLSLATKGMLGTGRQIAMDILYPGELPPEVYEQAMRHNQWVNRELGYQFGMLHTEYMVTPDNKLVLIEAANRGGGVFTSEIIVPGVSGVDLLGQYISDALGEKRSEFSKPIQRNQHLLTFFSFPPGKLSSIGSVEHLEADERIVQYRFAISPGDTIEEVSTDANRHGFLIVRCEGDIRTVAKELKQKFQPVYE